LFKRVACGFPDEVVVLCSAKAAPGQSESRGTRRLKWRVRLERRDQALIAAISGPTPKILIISLL